VADAKRIAGLVGPVLVALILSENQFANPHLYDKQIPPVVYLSGTLFLIAGLAIVRAHNRWRGGWPVLLTVVGWFAILLGLFRMFMPGLYEQGAQGNPTALLAGELILLGIGVFLTFKAYANPRV
jgi:cytochrome bd-type quinol oxidase subunit 2